MFARIAVLLAGLWPRCRPRLNRWAPTRRAASWSASCFPIPASMVPAAPAASIPMAPLPAPFSCAARAGALCGAPVRHPESEGRVDLRLGAGAVLRAVLQSQQDRFTQLPRLGLGHELRVLPVHASGWQGEFRRRHVAAATTRSIGERAAGIEAASYAAEPPRPAGAETAAADRASRCPSKRDPARSTRATGSRRSGRPCRPGRP